MIKNKKNYIKLCQGSILLSSSTLPDHDFFPLLMNCIQERTQALEVLVMLTCQVQRGGVPALGVSAVDILWGTELTAFPVRPCLWIFHARCV